MCGVLKNSKLQPCFYMYFSEDRYEHRSCLSNNGLKKEEGDVFCLSVMKIISKNVFENCLLSCKKGES